MEFTKMHGLGNDFVVVPHLKDVPKKVNQLAIDICDRHFGVGADGLVFILPSDSADVRMRIFNADGSEAEQCGNAIRCVAKYVYDHDIVKKEQLRIETLAGIQFVKLHIESNEDIVSKVEVDMGEPILSGELIPTTFEDDLIVDKTLEIDGVKFKFTGVSMGNPHAVIFVDDAINFDVEKWGPKIETHPLFPKKTNVEFVTVKSDTELDMRVWERGVGQTLACGTGACATGVASVLTGNTSRDVTVHLKGGDLRIVWNEKDNKVYMTGEAKEVFTGKWLGV
ncbi:diaminopimelate epimerase [Vulcanibacillus modesticaldus]|uniref:Diaminopimelate epimerase n=1 Tax=Vulcanibacillus modesticaldus TaxID=337097 RepID=A0A1D2YTR1_9BACI|nr:diaminopimelate epimerase [Vulcanibacillus modesticaldus]OEF99092.1 diaminopimelate epimerase [Vulcanibacillus modesticaldus]